MPKPRKALLSAVARSARHRLADEATPKLVNQSPSRKKEEKHA